MPDVDLQKLDPALLARIEMQMPEHETDRVVVIVALDHPARKAEIDRLEKHGFSTRSVIGDILTGEISLRDLKSFIKIKSVVKIESSGALFSEQITE